MHLEIREPFPQIRGTTIKDKDLVLPDDVEGKWCVLLFYRGHF